MDLIHCTGECSYGTPQGQRIVFGCLLYRLGVGVLSGGEGISPNVLENAAVGHPKLSVEALLPVAGSSATGHDTTVAAIPSLLAARYHRVRQPTSNVVCTQTPWYPAASLLGVAALPHSTNQRRA